MSHIKAIIEEFEMLKEKIRVNNLDNNTRNKPLRARVKHLEKEISDYLEMKSIPGIKHDGKAIILKKKEKKALKGKKDRRNCVIEMFKDLGIDNAEDVYVKLEDIQRKEPVEVKEIKLGKI